MNDAAVAIAAIETDDVSKFSFLDMRITPSSRRPSDQTGPVERLPVCADPNRGQPQMANRASDDLRSRPSTPALTSPRLSPGRPATCLVAGARHNEPSSFFRNLKDIDIIGNTNVDDRLLAEDQIAATNVVDSRLPPKRKGRCFQRPSGFPLSRETQDRRQPSISCSSFFAISSIFSGGQPGMSIPSRRPMLASTSLISFKLLRPKFGVRSISASVF